MEFQQGIGDGPQDGAAAEMQPPEADGRGGDFPIDRHLAPEKPAVVRGDPFDSGGEVHGNDGESGEKVGLVEEAPVHALLPRETAAQLQLIDGEAVVDASIRPDEGNGIVPVDAPVPEGDIGVDVRDELVLIPREEFVHQALLAEPARGQDGVEEVLPRQDAGTPAQLLEVPPGGEGEFPRPFPAEDQFRGGISLEHPVPDAVGDMGLEPDALAEFLRGPEAGLEAQSFRVVIGNRAGPGAESDARLRKFHIPRDHHPGDAVEPLVGR